MKEKKGKFDSLPTKESYIFLELYPIGKLEGFKFEFLAFGEPYLAANLVLEGSKFQGMSLNC